MKSREFDLTGGYALQKGFAWRFAFRRLQPNRRPVNLTGTTARIEIFDTQAGRQNPAVFPTQNALAANGEVDFNLTGAETSVLSAASGRYRIIFTDAAGEETVYLRGRLAILETWK